MINNTLEHQILGQTEPIHLHLCYYKTQDKCAQYSVKNRILQQNGFFRPEEQAGHKSFMWMQSLLACISKKSVIVKGYYDNPERVAAQ